MKRAIGIVKTSLFVAFSALIWTTCDVGLGEAVDTMAPTVSVSNPIASSVCAGPVTISGSCADDKGISAVEVVVKNTSTGKKYKFNGKVKNSSSWSVKINDIIKDSGYPLPDGSYTADATAIDIFGRTSGTSSTAFDIDNTPPVFCVTSPASLDISKPRKYGRSVTISGEIADDHDIAKMDIRVLRDNGEEITDKLAKTEFKDFETAGGTTVYIAKYFSDPTKISADDMPLYNNYMAMYGNTALKNDVYLYIVPTLTDIAGNTSEVCYLSSNLKNYLFLLHSGSGPKQDRPFRGLGSREKIVLFPFPDVGQFRLPDLCRRRQGDSFSAQGKTLRRFPEERRFSACADRRNDHRPAFQGITGVHQLCW